MRTARVLAATAVGCAAVVAAAPAAFAGETAAEVSPRTVAPGSVVTISVSCPDTGSAPATLAAHSQAFTNGSVRLHKVDDARVPGVGPAYNGTASIARTSGPTSEWSVDGSCPGDGRWSAGFTVAHGTPHHTKGVQGGLGGSFTDSPTTLITGGVLVAGVLGYAYHRTRAPKAAPQD